MERNQTLINAGFWVKAATVVRGNKTCLQWLRVILYMLIALTSSVLFRLQVIPGYRKFSEAHLYSGWLSALGPFSGALVLWLVKGYNLKRIAFRIYPVTDLVFLLCPILVFGGTGIRNTAGINPHIYGINLACWIFGYAVLEETGWRGYLQDELKAVPRYYRYLVIGTCWYIWHLTFLGQTSLQNEFLIWLILVAASWGIGQMYLKTGAVLVAACFHMTGNVLGLSNCFRELSLQDRMWLIIPCLFCWLILVRFRKKTVLCDRS